MGERVRFGDLAREAAQFRDALQAAATRVLERGWFVLGQEVEAFERELAAWLGAGFCVGCASGTDAITLALRAVGVGAGDEVVTVANTCGPTVVGVENSGARVRLVDCDPDTLMIDVAAIEAACTPATRAIVPVHLYGSAVDLEPLLGFARKRGLLVVEDCAQSHGSLYDGRKTGTFGDVAAFSFYPSKNLGAVGDGGACVTADPAIAERLRRLRNYGQSTRYTHATRGYNSRLDEIQAAFLRAKLPRLDEMNERRTAIARRYVEGLRGVASVRIPQVTARARSVHHLFPILHPERDELQRRLADRGVDTLIHYPVPIHLQPAYADLGYAQGAFPVAEQTMSQLLSLPMHPWLEPEEVGRVIEAVAR